MAAKFALLFICASFTILLSEVNCANSTKTEEDGTLEASRTFVQHAARRLAVLIPVVFFTLGIAFTLLVVVTLISTNNLFIGFILLVLGLAHALSRFTGFNSMNANNLNNGNSNNNNNGINGYNNPGFIQAHGHNLGYVTRSGPITAYYSPGATILRRQDDAGTTGPNWPTVNGAGSLASQSANVYGTDIVNNYNKYLQANSGRK